MIVVVFLVFSQRSFLTTRKGLAHLWQGSVRIIFSCTFMSSVQVEGLDCLASGAFKSEPVRCGIFTLGRSWAKVVVEVRGEDDNVELVVASLAVKLANTNELTQW